MSRTRHGWWVRLIAIAACGCAASCGARSTLESDLVLDGTSAGGHTASGGVNAGASGGSLLGGGASGSGAGASGGTLASGGSSLGGQAGASGSGTSGSSASGAANCSGGCELGLSCENGLCVCPVGTHPCGAGEDEVGVDCRSDSLTASCGTSCVRCPDPANGIATCDGKSCGVLCSLGFEACGDTCADLQTDSANCGTCAHDCQGGACNSGQCQPFALLTNAPHLDFIAIDAAKVYLALDGLVDTAPLAGGPLTTLLTGPFDEGIAVNATALFDATYTGNSVVAFPIGGGVVSTTLISNITEPFGIAIDAKNLYFTGFKGGVFSAPLSGGTPTTLYTSPEPAYLAIATGIAVNSRGIYFAADGGVRSMPLTGGTPTLLATVLNEAFGVAVDDTYVYWTTLYSGSVTKIPLAGGSTTSLASGYTYGAGIAVNDKSIYFATNSTTNVGTLWRLAK